MIPLRRLATLVTELPQRPLPRVTLDMIESGTGRLVTEPRDSDDVPDAGFVAAIPGDVLFGKLRPYLAKVWRVDRPVAAGSEFLCLRPHSDVDGRWLGAVMASERSISWAVATSDGAKMPRTTWEKVAAMTVQVPTFAEQREIANHLDREKARIDALIAAKRRMRSVLALRRQAFVDQLVAGATPVRLRRVISRLTSGPRGWSQFASETGVPFLRISNVQTDDIALNLDDLLLVTPPDGTEAERTRTSVGDVVLSITAEIGSVGVVTGSIGHAHVSQHLALMTPVACSGEWLALGLSSSSVRAQLDAATYGGTKIQLSLEDVKELLVPVVGSARESHQLAIAAVHFAQLRELTQRLQEQIQFLQERRQSLITAAVTGQLPVPVPA